RSRSTSGATTARRPRTWWRSISTTCATRSTAACRGRSFAPFVESATPSRTEDVNSLIARIRWRLVGWNILILGLILVLAGASIYAAVQRSLLDEVDSNLLARSQQAIPFLFPVRSRTDDFRHSRTPSQHPPPPLT